MRILFVQPYITFPGVMEDTLPGQLARMGHEVLVATFTRQPLPSPSSSNTSVPRLKFMAVGGISLSIPSFVSEFPLMVGLEQVAGSFHPDIIHANNLPFLTTLQGARAARKLKVGGVVHVNGVVMERAPLFNALQRIFLRLFGPRIFGSADRIICVNLSDALEIERYGAPAAKIAIIPNAVDVEKFSPSGKRAGNTILWSGRFVKQKGLEYLVEAMEILVRRKGMAEASLILTGDGPLLPRIQGMVRQLGLERNVSFLGRVSRQEVARQMASCAIYALPSVSEAMPTYALLEAMSSGAAVITTDIPGVRSLFRPFPAGSNDPGDGPVELVPPRDPAALANAMEMLLRDGALRARLGEKARSLVLKKYDLRMTAGTVESLYAGIAGGHGITRGDH